MYARSKFVRGGKVLALLLVPALLSACATSGAGRRVDRASPGASRPETTRARERNPGTAEREVPSAGEPAGGAASVSCDAAAADDELIGRGRTALEHGDFATARGCFDAALAHEPAAPPALYGRGNVALAEGDRPAAIEWFRRAAEAAPGFTEAWLSLREAELAEARSLLLGHPGESVTAHDAAATDAAAEDSRARYRRVISLAPRLLPPYLALADSAWARRDAQEAIRILREAQAQLGNRPILLERLAVAYLETGETAAAMAAAGELVRMRPNDAKAAELLDRARSRHERTALPADFRRLETKPVIRREDLAALLVVNVTALQQIRLPERQPIVNDVAGSWAELHVRRVAALGAMDTFANHEFAPDLEVTRGMLAEVLARTLRIVSRGSPAASDVAIVDVPAEHLNHEAVKLVVGSGLMRLDQRGRFHIMDAVSGQEAVAATRRLAALATAGTARR
jgi:tetratricopeptide (TPR) repeat protein